MMIQPAMQAYSMGSPQPEPVMLDVASVMPDRVLLLDSYFTVVVWHGSTVAQWRKADYHLQEEYAHLKPLMEVSCQCTKNCNDFHALEVFSDLGAGSMEPSTGTKLASWPCTMEGLTA